MRETKKFEHTEKIITRDFEGGEDDFLQVKRKDEQIDIEKLKIDPFKVSKNQLKKVREGGIFGGRNIFDIEEDGNMVSLADKKKQGYQHNEEILDNENINLIQKRKQKLEETREADKQMERERIRNKKLKRKFRKSPQEEPQDLEESQ